jgi:hypothetical protein
VIACAVGIVVACRSCLETDEARGKHAELNRTKQLRRLADKISLYGRRVQQRYPTGPAVCPIWRNSFASAQRPLPPH